MRSRSNVSAMNEKHLQKIFLLFFKKGLTNEIECGIIPVLSEDSRFR
jgi:hypothetical protein